MEIGNDNVENFFILVLQNHNNINKKTRAKD